MISSRAPAAAGDPSQPPPQHRVRRTRAGTAWTGLVLGVLFLVALIIFIAQNGHRTEVSFLGLHAHIANGLALLIAAVVGALIALLAGSVRIVQLRRIAHRHRRLDNRRGAGVAAPGSTDLPQPASGPAPPEVRPSAEPQAPAP